MLNELDKLRIAKKEYLSNRNISQFIDLLVKYTADTIDSNLLVGYKPEIIELIIKEFWVTGRAIFDYPCKSYEHIIKLYDPEYLRISAIPSSLRCRITHLDEDISDKTIFLARRENKFDWLGTSIIGSDSRIKSFGLEDFNTALCNAINIFNGV